MTTSSGTVVLVRHGETEWNRTRRVQGWAPVGLNETGRGQARAAGAYLRDEYAPDRLVASDLRRTRETARLVRREAGIDHADVTFESGWRERSFGVLQGLSYDAVFEDRPEFAVEASGVAALEATPEAGESIVSARRRVLGALDRLVDGLDGETVAVVTHGGPIHLVRAHLQDRDLISELRSSHTTNGSLHELRVEEGRATVRGDEVVPADAPDPDATTGGIR